MFCRSILVLGFRKEVVLKGGHASLDLTSLTCMVFRIFLPCSFLQGRGTSPLFYHYFRVFEVLNTLHLLLPLLILSQFSDTNSYHWPQFILSSLFLVNMLNNFFHLISREKQVPKVPISDVNIFKG